MRLTMRSLNMKENSVCKLFHNSAGSQNLTGRQFGPSWVAKAHVSLLSTSTICQKAELRKCAYNMRGFEIIKPLCLKHNFLILFKHQNFPYLCIFLYTGQEKVKRQVFCVFLFNILSINKPAIAGHQQKTESYTAMTYINRISN